MLKENILKNDEKAVYLLRSLYRRFGYSRYKMSKFEEYDLYVRNKDFLISDGIITFTDTNGRLLALKPDVTLSIIKNAKDCPGLVQKFYYNENVYRISDDSHCFKEINQTGLECIGDIGVYDICEVLYLAVKSLESIDKSFILDIAHAGLMNAVINQCSLSEQGRKALINAIQNKSIHEAAALVNKGVITREGYTAAEKLIATYKSCSEAEAALSCYGEAVKAALGEFSDICSSAESLGITENLRIDFSILSDSDYYSGLAFKGYIKGISSTVLSGGQYDKLMKKMGRSASAIGFAVYLDTLERHGRENADYDYDFVVIREEGADTASVIRTVEALSQKGLSVMVTSQMPRDIRYGSLIRMTKDGMEGA